MAYATSSFYKKAIEKETRTTFIDGEIILENKSHITITNDMLVPGGLYITNQCTNSDSFEYGSVFSAELGITLKTEIDRYTLYGAEIKLGFNILLENNEYERVPLGVFYINEPNRIGKNLSIKAYDKMVDLDVEVYESTTGTPYELLTYLSARCRVALAQTKEEINSFINSGAILTVSSDKISTFRELLSYICTVTCTFASFDREGKLRLYEFANVPSKEINSKSRTSSKFSDFETFFTGAKGEFVYNGANKSYSHISSADGLVYDMGSVPIVQGLDTTNQAIVANVSLKTSYMKYTPCDISFSGDPAIDLGDMILNVDRQGNEINSLVTFYRWSYRGRHQIKSAGQNPKLLKVKGKSSKEIENIKSDISSKDVSVYTYTNSSVISISGGDSNNAENMSPVATISFTSKKAATCMFMATIPIEISEDSDVEFHLLFDGFEMLGGVVSQRCHKGLGTITFVNYFSTATNSIHKISIVGITKGVDGGAVGTAIINPYSLRAIVFGQGLSSVVNWDGEITVNDTVPVMVINVDDVSYVNISDELVAKTNAYNPKAISDKVKVITITSDEVEVVGFSSTIETGFDL